MSEPLNPEREQEIRAHVAGTTNWSLGNRAARDLLAELDRARAELAHSERIRENADFHLGQEMARRQLAEKTSATAEAERDQAFRRRDAAQRALNRDDVELDIDLEESIAAPFYGPGWDWDEADLKHVVREVVDVVRPALGKLTEERDRARRIAVALEQETARLEDELAEEKADRNPRLRCLLVKAAKDRDMYVGWSNVCEMPAGLWTRAEALAYGFPRSRLDRADENGSSDLSCGDGHWGDAGFIAEQRGWLRRDRLGDYAQLWLADRQGEAFDLLEPFEDESEVRR